MMKKWVISFCTLLFLLLFTLSVSAKLFITSYCDVSLEACKSQDQALVLLQKDYPSDIVVHYLYYFDTSDAKSSLAQIALECANRESMKDAYKTYLQDHLEEQQITRASLKSSADVVGLAAANFTFCLDTQETAYDVLAQVENAEEEGATTVPSIRFGDHMYTGPQTYTSLNTLVKEYLGLTAEYSEETTTEMSSSETTASSSSGTSSTSSSETPSSEETTEASSSETTSSGTEQMQNIEQPLFFRVISQFRTWLLGVFS